MMVTSTSEVGCAHHHLHADEINVTFLEQKSTMSDQLLAICAAGSEDLGMLGDSEQLEPAPDVEQALRIIESGAQLPPRTVRPPGPVLIYCG